MNGRGKIRGGVEEVGSGGVLGWWVACRMERLRAFEGRRRGRLVFTRSVLVHDGGWAWHKTYSLFFCLIEMFVVGCGGVGALPF